MVTMDVISEDLEEMKKQFPSFKIVNESGTGLGHQANVFLYEKKYDGFEAKFYAVVLPACFLGSDVYKNNEFQYSIFTHTGEWKENLNMLEKILKKISKKGIDAVKPQLDGSKLEIYHEKIESVLL